jgi:hypothetical protein
VVVFDTINRSIFSYLAIFWIAQEIFPLIPPGAHDWQLFIRPTELLEIFARHKLVGEISEWKGLTPEFGFPDERSWMPGITGFRTSEDLSGSYAGYFVKLSA